MFPDKKYQSPDHPNMRFPSPQTTSLSPLGRAITALALASTLSHAAFAQNPTPAPSTPAPAAAPEVVEIQRMIKSGQNTQALKLIDDALARNPKDAAMRFRRGVTLSMLDRKAEALAVFQKLVEDYPDMPAPYNNLAVIYGSQGDYDKARAALERAIRTNPAYATAYQNLGDVYAQLASQAYAKALQLDKSDTTVPPKLALLRELASGPGLPAVAATSVLAAAAPIPAPVSTAHPAQVAAATPAPLPAPAAHPAPSQALPVPAQRPLPAPVVAAKPAPVAVVAARPAPAPSVATKSTPAAAPVAALKPAPAPAPTTVAAVKPATVANPAPASGGAVAEVEAAVHAWASAWSRRDMTGYLGAYGADFTGSAHTHKAWEDDRRARILPRKRIAVEIAELHVSVNGDRAEARFKQTYASDTLNTSGHKTLTLQRSPAGKWLIRQESVGG